MYVNYYSQLLTELSTFWCHYTEQTNIHNYSDYAEYSKNKTKMIRCFTLALFQSNSFSHLKYFKYGQHY